MAKKPLKKAKTTKKSAPKKKKSAARKRTLSSSKTMKKSLKKVGSAKSVMGGKRVKIAKKAAKRKASPVKVTKRKSSVARKVKPAADIAVSRSPFVDALRFISALPLPAQPDGTRGLDGQDVISFTTEKSESVMVGSDIVSFAAGLPEGMRTVITNSLLLAQLAASKKVGDSEKTTEWYKTYFNVLTTLGWVIQEQGFTEHEESGKEFEVHKAILAVAATVFSAGATALAIITSTLNALEKMGDGPWLTIFKKKSERGKVAQFQVTVVEPIGDGGCKISLMAFELEGKNNLTQVLFFKFNSSSVTLKHASGTVTLDKEMVEDLGPAIANKVRPFQLDFIANIPVG
ncbi:hypothetical protein WBG78_04530 [Chryseolinea sp. T2]|uniref:hypothetical protein n=1 Tax=Chryseolinea sp. T2 TaxID=3129255 RepID=UPI003076D0E6